MYWHGWRKKKHCRWDGKAYEAHKPTGKDGFCSARCKQAHYRAYKAYVTRIQGSKKRSLRPKRQK